MNNNKTKLYAIKTDETIHYIGKTKRENSQGKILKSNLSTTYINENLRKVYEDHQNIIIEEIKIVDDDEWYDEKLQEVVQKYAEKHPLVNAQWMLDGKRGIEYWTGKKRDANTLKALSESKYKKVCQFDSNGKLVNIWGSAKEVAIQVFNDYKIVNGSASSRIYKVLANKSVKSSFVNDYYWYRYDDIIQHFGKIPTKLNIDAMLAKEKQMKKNSVRKKYSLKPYFKKTYTVIQYDNNDVEINRFNNVNEASKKLGIGVNNVKRYCTKITKNKKYNLKYGEKTKQKIIFKD